jgi:5-amino-6-(5-phosphoribosylamino)uracil reductase
LIYEGLSRIDADAVMAGAATARSERMVFSIWHPELVALRLRRGRPRHPAQIVVSDRGDLPIERGLMFNQPSLRTFIVTRSRTVGGLRARLANRPSVEVIDAGDPLSLRAAMHQLFQCGLKVISCVGGRTLATTMIRDGLVGELYLTTSPIEAGEPGTPFYEGPRLATRPVVEKRGVGEEAGVRFEHLLLERD